MSYNSWTVLSQIQKGKNKITKALKKRFNLLKRLGKRDIPKQVTKKVDSNFDSNFANTALNYHTAYAQDRLNRY